MLVSDVGPRSWQNELQKIPCYCCPVFPREVALPLLNQTIKGNSRVSVSGIGVRSACVGWVSAYGWVG